MAERAKEGIPPLALDSSQDRVLGQFLWLPKKPKVVSCDGMLLTVDYITLDTFGMIIVVEIPMEQSG